MEAMFRARKWPPGSWAAVGRWLLWIALGTLFSTAAAPSPGSQAHWAFQPVVRPRLPDVRNIQWPQSPVDRFVLSRMEAEGLTPLPQAPRRVLIRRVTLDLTGLPPTPDEVEAFLADPEPDAFARIVNRLLASPAYGERWGRHWLDVARYADTKGYVRLNENPRYVSAWTYRDYVIRAMNDDKPYDRFVQEQIAGDELFPDDPQATVALGFLRNFPDESNAEDIPLRRQEILNDITDTVGSV